MTHSDAPDGHDAHPEDRADDGAPPVPDGATERSERSERAERRTPSAAPRPRGPGPVGTTGATSGASLLQQLQRNGSSGTLALERNGGATLLLLAGGALRRSVRVGTYAEIDAAGQRFRFDPHPAGDCPQLATLFPGSAVPVLRALPSLGPAHEIPAGISDLRALLRRLEADRFAGALRLSDRDEHGLALLVRGRIVAAWYERDAYRLGRNDALRAIYRYSLDEERAPLALEPLPEALLLALLGMVASRSADDPNLTTYSGLEADERGYHYVEHGERMLHIPAELVGDARRYRRLDEADLERLLPDLHLPDDPPGWEERSYALTLRGQDAVNPMTELSMQFNEEFGDSGRRILDALARGATIEQAASALGLDLEELKPWLRRLEDDGLIRPRG